MSTVHLYDIDGVLAESHEPIISAYNARFATNFSYQDWQEFDTLSQLYSRRTGESLESAANWLFSDQHMSAARPYQEAVKLTEHWHTQGISQFVMTSRPPNQAALTVHWLSTHFSWFQQNHFFINQNQQYLDGDHLKATVVTKLNPQLYLEDNPHTALHVVANHKSANTCLKVIQHPWNQRQELLKPYFTSWQSLTAQATSLL